MGIKKILSSAFVVLSLATGLQLVTSVNVSAVAYQVTTVADENSEPLAGAGCSLYEISRAFLANAAYGGCVAPDPSGNTITLPSGAYSQTFVFELDNIAAANGIVIRGDTDGTTTINADAGLWASIYIEVADATVQDLTVQGKRIETYGVNTTFENVVLRNSVNGFNVGSSGVTFRDITVENISGGDGIGVYDDDASFTNVTLTNIDSDGIGIYGDNASFTNIRITTTGGDGIGVYGDATVANEGPVFTDIVVDGVDRDGIGVYDNDPVLINITVRNTVSGDGIGIYGDNAQLTDILVEDIGRTGIFAGFGDLPYQYVTFENITIRNTVAEGIWVSFNQSDGTGGSLEINRASITGSSDSWGILNTRLADITITNSYIADNAWGGIDNDACDATVGMLDISNTWISNNGNSALGSRGGGITNWCGRLSLDKVTISGNQAVMGGGIYSVYEFNSSSPAQYVDMTNVTIFDNSATIGGGVYIEDMTTIPSGITDPDFAFLNTTIARNSAPTSAGIYVDRNGRTAALPSLINTIVASNIGDVQCGGDAVLTGFGSDTINNLSSDSSCTGFTFQDTDPMVSTTLVFDGEGMILGSQTGEGVLPILPLLTGSAAIDGGDNSACASVDPRDRDRFLGEACDIGAYEWGYVEGVVTQPSEGGPVPSAPNTGSRSTGFALLGWQFVNRM